MQDTPSPVSPLPEALGRLMRDPALLSRIGEIVKTAAEAPPSEETAAPSPKDAQSAPPEEASAKTEAETETETETEKSPSLPVGTSPLAASPALLEMLPALLSSFGGRLPSGTGRGKGPMGEREALLCALKPFLSPARREAVDTVLRVARIRELLQGLQSGQERS